MTVDTAYDRESSLRYDDERFRTPHGKCFDRLEKQQLCRAMRCLKAPKRILEVGCGTGRFTLLALGANNLVFGVDPSLHMLGLAASKASSVGQACWVQGEGALLPFSDDSFDLVYSIRVLNQMASSEYALRAVEEMLRVSSKWVLAEFVNRRRLFKRSDLGVQLVVADVERLVGSDSGVHLVDTSGVLFFSQSILRKIPVSFLPLFVKVDGWLSSRLPHLCSRIYMTLRKIDVLEQ